MCERRFKHFANRLHGHRLNPNEDIEGGWLPQLPELRQTKRGIRATKFFKDLKGLPVNEEIVRLINLFWDLEAEKKNPRIDAYKAEDLEGLQKSVLRRLPAEQRNAIRTQLKAYRRTQRAYHRPLIRTPEERAERWQRFIGEVDPERENKAFLYDLDDVKAERRTRALTRNALTRAQQIANRAPRAPRAETAWMRHVREFRAANPGISFKDAMRGAKETYIPQPRAPRRPIIGKRKKRITVDMKEPPLIVPRITAPLEIPSLPEIPEPLVIPGIVDEFAEPAAAAPVALRKRGRPAREVKYIDRVAAYMKAHGVTQRAAKAALKGVAYNPELGYGGGILRGLWNNPFTNAIKKIVY